MSAPAVPPPSAAPRPPAPPAPAPAAGAAPKLTDVIVGIGDARVARGADERLITYALGSCLGVVLHDPVQKIAGMLHAMLPQASADPTKAEVMPAMFVDTGVAALLAAFQAAGGVPGRARVVVAGGQNSTNPQDVFQIGKRNILTLRQVLWRHNLILAASALGGTQVPRTLSVDVATGLVLVRTNNQSQTL